MAVRCAAPSGSANMGAVSQTIPNLVGGVSQAPPALRDPASVESLRNAVASMALGLQTRPPARFAAVLGDLADSLDSAHVHEIEFSNTERYLLVLTDGVCRLFNAETGAEEVVNVPAESLPYLSELGDGAFEALSVGRDIFILNKEKFVALGTQTEPTRPPEALIFVRAGDFSTTYTIEVDGVVASYKTPAGTDASQREFISTDYIAEQLEMAFRATTAAGHYKLHRAGNVIYIRQNAGNYFTLKSSDGLGGGAMLVVKGAIDSANELPLELPEEAAGFVVEVLGDAPTSDGEGTYWLKLVNGRWEETPRPGVRTTLDAATMPHILKQGATVIERTTQRGAPPAPSRVSVVNSYVGGSWLGSELTLVGDGATVESAPIPEYDGGIWTTRIDYFVSPIGSPEGLTISIVFESSPDGAVWTPRATHQVDLTSGPYSGVGTWTGALPANSRWRVRLAFSEPAIDGVSVLVFQDNNGVPGIRASDNSIAVVQVPTSAFYPAGTVIDFTVAGTPVSYAVPEPGLSAQALVDALVAAIIAASIPNVVTTAGATGRINIRGTTGTAPDVTVSSTFDSASTLFDGDLALVPGALVGFTLESLVDGSTATIVGNGAKTIEVGAWSGVATALVTLGTYRVKFSNEVWHLAQAPWESRYAGDDESAPPPSFLSRNITGMFTYQNRLGLLTGDAFVLSSSKSFYRFFRESSRQVLDSDVIDVRSRARPGEVFYHSFAWNGNLYLSTEKTQHRLYGDPMLTPRTIGLDVVSEFPVSRRCKPVAIGTRLYFATELDGAAQVVEVFALQNEKLVGASLTAHVPSYLTGTPVKLVGDGTLHQLLLVTEDGGGRRLWSLNLGYGSEGLTQIAWGEWTLGSLASPVSAAAIGGDVLLLVRRPGGYFLEVMDLIEGHGDFLSLDAQVRATGVFDGTNTTWTLPYQNSGGAVITVVPDGGAALEASPAGTSVIVAGDYSGPATLGYAYQMEVTPSRLFLRGRDGKPDLRGRLVLAVVRVVLDRTSALAATVATPGRSTKTRMFSGLGVADETFPVPILANANGVTLTFASSITPARISSLEWEGEFTPRNSRV